MSEKKVQAQVVQVNGGAVNVTHVNVVFTLLESADGTQGQISLTVPIDQASNFIVGQNYAVTFTPAAGAAPAPTAS